MPTYIGKYKGYVADAADIEFIRCDNKVFSCKEATATNITPGGDALTVTGGQSAFPLAFIDSTKTLDIGFTNAAFDMDMFEMTGTEAATDGAEDITISELVEIKKTGTTLYGHTSNVFKTTGAYYIGGLEYASGTTPAAGKFGVTTADEGETGSKLLFNEADVAEGDTIMVLYTFSAANVHSVPVKTDSPSAKGEVWMHFPLYSSGEDCTDSAIMGIIDVHIFRCRVTTPANIDTSYKTAATFPVQFSSIDPRRADKKMYEIIYRPNPA